MADEEHDQRQGRGAAGEARDGATREPPGGEEPSRDATGETNVPGAAGESAACAAPPAKPGATSRARPPAPYPPPVFPPHPRRDSAPYPSPAPTQPGAGAAVTPPAPLHELRPAGQAARIPRWGWRQSLWGLLLGLGPFVALYAATYSMTGDADVEADDVTLATAVIFVVSAAIGYGWQLFAAWLFSVRSAPGKLRAWGFRRPTAAFFWTIPVTLVAAYAVSYANDVAFDPPQQDIVEAFPPTAGGIVLFTVVAVIMAPLAEELFFRGFVFKGFAESWGWFRAAAVSGAVFSLAHVQLSLFFPLFALGFGLAWVYHRTGSLWTSITLHAIFNGAAVVAWALAG